MNTRLLCQGSAVIPAATLAVMHSQNHRNDGADGQEVHDPKGSGDGKLDLEKLFGIGNTGTEPQIDHDGHPPTLCAIDAPGSHRGRSRQLLGIGLRLGRCYHPGVDAGPDAVAHEMTELAAA